MATVTAGLPSSGTISASQINTELGRILLPGRSSTANFDINAVDPRWLADKVGDGVAISFSNFYGKHYFEITSDSSTADEDGGGGGTTAAPTTTTTTAAPTTTTTTAAPIGPLEFNGKTYGFIKSTAGVAKLTLRFFDNGIWQIIPSNTGSNPVPQNDLLTWSLVTGNWYSPQTAGIGSGYLYRVTATNIVIGGAGSVFPDFTGAGSWLPFTLTGDPELTSVSITAGSGDEASIDATVEIAINNGGSPGTILSTSIVSLYGSRGA